MRAARWTADGLVELVDAPLPEPEPGWVRLAVAATGICGSDLHRFRVADSDRAGAQPGHEIAGYGDIAGEGVDLGSNRLFAVEPLVSCNRCDPCRLGFYNRCRQRRLIGVHAPGGLAEFVLAPADRVHPLPTGFDKHLAVLAEPVAVCIRAARLGEVADKTVVIIGAGSIGLLCIPAAFAAGAREVHVLARHPHQIDLARHLGATAIHTRPDDLGEECADVVIETVGGEADTLIDAAALAKAGATIIKLGVFIGNTPIPSLPFLDKELTLIGSLCYASDAGRGDFAQGVDLLVERHAELEPLITHRYGLGDLADAFATAADKTSKSIKVQITP